MNDVKTKKKFSRKGDTTIISKRGLKRAFAMVLSAVVICASLMPVNVYAAESLGANGDEATGKGEEVVELATGSDYVEIPTFVDEPEETTQEVMDELIEDEQDEQSEQDSTVEWECREHSDGTVWIHITNGGTDFVVPSEVDGKTVTHICMNTVGPGSDSSTIRDLKSIEIPATVTNIVNLYVQDSVNIDQNNANYKSIDGIVYDKNVETLLYCPNGRRTMQIPSSVTRIGDDAFSYNDGLTTIHIPSNVIGIGNCAFEGCDNLTEIVLSEGIETIGNFAFEGCDNLTNIELPDSIRRIGSSLFDGCSNLKSVKLPQHIGDIPDRTFARCSSLTDIELPEGIYGIYLGAFYGCTSLAGINIPSSVEYITGDEYGDSGRVFEGCDKLTIYGEKGSRAESYASEYNIPFVISEVSTENWEYTNNVDGTVTIKRYKGSDTELVIPEQIDGKSVTGIWYSAFYDCSSLTSIEIPSSVTRIRNSAFLNCSNLVSINVNAGNANYKSINGILYDSDMKTLVCCPAGISGTVEIPEGVTSIGSYAFERCSSLTSIEIPSGVTNIGEGAFESCSSLKSIEIPASVTSIGLWAFCGCSSLVSINVNADNVSYKSINGILYDGDMKTLICYPAGISGTAEIPSSMTSIGDSAFFDCSGLISIEIPEGVTSIGEDALAYCSSLTSIEIPSSVTSIGYNAFYRCSNLVSIDVNANNVSYKSINGILYDGSMKTLICCPAGISGTAEILSGVTSIDDFAFQGCSNLTSIEISSSVTSIGSGAFSDCSGLVSIKIPSSVTSIGYNAFSYCDILTIYGIAGSTAEAYANEHNIPFVAISGEQTTVHKAVKTKAKAPTETRAGNIAYWYCSECGKYFSDEALTREISKASTVIPATGHRAQKTEAKAPTKTKEGNIAYWYCSGCGKYFSDEALTKEISKASTVIPATGVTPEKAPEIKGRWILDPVGWWYRHEDSSYTANGWEAVSGKWYHFNARGYMETGWLLVNGKWYYLEPSGAMATGWKLVNGTWYYLDPINGDMATGWKLVNGTWYYLEASGAMATGWKLVNGTWYYLESSGAMATGWKLVNGAWYYLKASGAMATGWILDRGTWYYLYDSGAMAANTYIGACYVNASGAWVK